jgi:hypothetical protein
MAHDLERWEHEAETEYIAKAVGRLNSREDHARDRGFAG